MAQLPSAAVGWWSWLTSRRVPWKWVCSPALLVVPIPAPGADRRADGPARTKWAGVAPLGEWFGSAKAVLGQCGVSVSFLAVLGLYEHCGGARIVRVLWRH